MLMTFTLTHNPSETKNPLQKIARVAGSAVMLRNVQKMFMFRN